jgi:acetyltransferase-like isoleucine patch superfamily enzyme
MNDEYRRQHKLRLSWMPWLYYSLKPEHRTWAQAWQEEVQAELMRLETVRIGRNCFIAPEARLFAEPHRDIVIEDGCSIAAEAFLHGPIRLEENVSINHRVSIDGGRRGVSIGAGSRIAAHTSIYAFNHGTAPQLPVSAQPVDSRGIVIGRDVWIGASVGITDGVRIEDHAVVGMGSIVTRDVDAWSIVAGNPARPIGDRRER